MKRAGLVLIACVLQLILSICGSVQSAVAATLQININGTGRVAGPNGFSTTTSTSLTVPVVTYPFTIPVPVLLVAELTDPVNFTFAGWSGCNGTSGLGCNLMVSGDRTVTASFVRGDAQVQLTVNGTGSGTVTTTPAGLATNVSDKAGFPQSLGLPLSLNAHASPYSIFSGWSGPGGCSGTAATCNTTFVPPYNDITATFNIDTAHSVLADGIYLLGTDYFSSIQDAYLATNKSGYIKAWAIDFNENLICTTAKSIWLQGGFDSAFGKQTGVTTMKGPLIVRSGKLMVENVLLSGVASDRIKPTVPTGLTATPVSINRIDLSWSPSTDNFGVSGYNIYHGATFVKSVTGTSTSDTGLWSGTMYCYSISAYDAAGNESALSSPQVCATTPRDTIPPTAPTNLTATIGAATQVNLSWTAATDNEAVDVYAIYRYPIFLKTVPGTSTSAIDTGLGANTRYCYTVEAIDRGGNATLSSEVCIVTPMAGEPTNLTVTPVDKSSSKLHLTWSHNSIGETGTKINRSTDNIHFTEVATLANYGVTNWEDSGLNPCTTYYYQVYAYSTPYAATTLSATASGTTAPAAPTGLKASMGMSLLGINLNWNTSTCASTYRIYGSDNINYIYTLLGDIPENLANFTNTIPDTYLFYRVAAVNALGKEGDVSCTVASGVSWSGATSANDACHAAVGWAASPKPANAWASIGNYVNLIMIGWSPVQLTWNYNGQGSDTYATTYNVWYSTDATGDYSTKNWIQLPNRVVPSNSSLPITMQITPGSNNYWYHFKISTAGYPDYPNYVSGWAASGAAATTPATLQVTATVYLPSYITVQWSAIEGATSYDVQRANSSGGPFTTIRTFNAPTSFFFNSTSDSSYPITAGYNYWYRVRALVNGTAGAWSDTAMGNSIEFLP